MALDNMFSVLVADDEQHSRERLVDILEGLKGVLPIRDIISVSDGMQAFDILTSMDSDETKRPGMAFLDIEMPKMSGLELAHHLAKMKRPPIVVFVTAHDEFAVAAFEAQALDYVLKPARKERVADVFSRIERLGTVRERVSDQALAHAGMKGRTHVSVSERGRVRLIPVEDIVYLKSELKYTTIKTPDREFLTEEPLIGFEQEFGSRFLRIHRNCLIPRLRLRGFEKNSDNESGWAAVIDGLEEHLPVSRRQWVSIREMKIF